MTVTAPAPRAVASKEVTDEQRESPIVYLVADAEKATAVTRHDPLVYALMGVEFPRQFALQVFSLADVATWQIDLTRPRHVFVSLAAAEQVRDALHSESVTIVTTEDDSPDRWARAAIRLGAPTVVTLPSATDHVRQIVLAEFSPAPEPTPAPAESVAELLAAHAEWSADRQDLSDAENSDEPGVVDWSDSDDQGVDLADRLAHALRTQQDALRALLVVWDAHAADLAAPPGEHGYDTSQQAANDTESEAYADAAGSLRAVID